MTPQRDQSFGARGPHATVPRALCAGLVLLAIGVLIVPLAAQERLVIDAAQPIGPATFRASGFLASMSDRQPPDDIIRAVKPQLFRLNDQYASLYRRAVSLGARAQMVASYPKFKGPAKGATLSSWMPTWETHLKRLVEETARRNETWQWDIWNEPNWPRFWTGTRDQYFETWEMSHRLIKSRIRDAVIVGPSIAYYDAAYLKAFLREAKSKRVLPDVLSWHELNPNSPASIPQRVAEMQKFMKDNGIPISRIQLNEVSAPTHQVRPGHLVWFMAAVERAGVEAAAKSCWLDGFAHNCINDSLNGLLGGGRPRSAYWAYAAYADITGQLVTVTPSRRFDAVAGYDGGTFRALVANHESKRGSVVVEITGVRAIRGLADRGRVRVVARKIPNTERKPLEAPEPLFDNVAAVEGDTLRVELPDVDGYSVITLEIGAGRDTEARRRRR